MNSIKNIYILLLFVGLNCWSTKIFSYSFDTLSYKSYFDTVKFYIGKNPERAIKLGKELLLYIEKRAEIDELITLYNHLALAYYYSGDRKESLTYLNLQRQLLHKKGDNEGLAQVYNRIGAIFHEWSLFSEALSNYNKAYQYALKSDKIALLGQTYNNLGLISKDQGNYDKAFDYFIKAKEIYHQINDQKNLSYTYNNIGIVYKKIGSYEKALNYFKESLELKKKIGETRTLANSYGNIAEVYLLMKNYELAEKTFNEALVLHTQANDKENIIKDIIALAKIACLTNQLEKARNYLSNAKQLINNKTSKDVKRYYVEIQALYYEKTNQYKEAVELYKYINEFDDSIFNEQYLQKSLELEYLINQSVKEHELNNLRIEHQQALEKLRKNLTFKYLLIIVLIILFFVLLLVFVRLRIGQKSKLVIQEKNLEIEKINEELISTNEELEQRVNERTNELLKEINEKEKALKQLEVAIKKMEESNFLKDAFLANINHEIRTPLSAIVGLSEVLKGKIKASEHPDLIKYIDGIVQSSNRLLNLLNNIIDISRAEANDIKPHFSVCNPNKIVKKVGDLFVFRINEKKLELQYLLGDVPAVRCDHDLLFKVLVEVLDNAVKYTNKGKITLATTYIPASGNVKISVSDTGIGIEETYLSNIFEAFRQEQMGFDRPFQGAGLGLPLAKRLVKLMGGTIEISSKKNFGTTVNIILPSSEEVPQSEVDTQKIETIVGDKKGRVLLVEDDDFNALFLITILEPVAKVTWVKTGSETIEVIENNLQKPFDVVILDINLPQEWEGGMLLKVIKEKYPPYLHVPFIAQTAYSMPSDKEKFIESGFVEYFSKPISTEHFLNTVKLLLMQRENNYNTN
ncbi:MAG: tetratricopeptide repeat protein [Bacteroidales bacterium]|nr:tetratricopeptide repeat protein [Bacteroidales bacterium]